MGDEENARFLTRKECGEFVIERTYSLKVDKSGTPEAAYAALAEQQRAIAGQVKAVTGLLNALIAGARKAAPIPLSGVSSSGDLR